MFRSWKLGTAFGIGIFVHWSFLLLPTIILLENLGSGLTAAVQSVTLLAAVFGCVVLHELGHALTARHFGIPTRDITLYPIGGVARLERMSEKPWEEFWIAVMGPAVNVVIVAFLVLLMNLFQIAVPNTLAGWKDLNAVQQLIIMLLLTNVIMIVFNMLPAFPMDGGRVLRALLAAGLGHLRATEIAATLGVFMAGLIVLTGFGLFRGTDIWLLGAINGNVFLVFVGLFVLFAGQQELYMVRERARVRELQRRGLWPAWYGNEQAAVGQPGVVIQQGNPPDASVLAPFLVDGSALPAEPNFSGFTWDAGRRAWIEWRNGRPVHICWVE